MSAVILDVQDYDDFYHRGSKVAKMLRPLCRNPHGPAYEVKQGIGNKKIIATHEGSAVQSDFTGWRFATKSQGYWAGYYETWSSVDGAGNKYELEKAYLTVYREHSEFLCLHCDPTEVGNQQRVEYKRAPHLHIECAESPIPKAHISVCIGNNAEVLADIDHLTHTFELGIEMIKLEIMDNL